MKPLFCLLIPVVLASGCLYTGSTQKVTAEVTRVVDGDTVHAEFDSRSETVRFNGIDTPEINVENEPFKFEGVPDSEEGRECLRKWGRSATVYVKERVANSTVTLEYRSGLLGDERGDYGRLLGTIYYNNTDLNRQLVEKGFARSYTEEGPYFEQEVDAKLEMKGLWSCQEVS